MTVRTHLTVKRSLLLRTILRKRQDLYMNVGQPLPPNAKAFDKIIYCNVFVYLIIYYAMLKNIVKFIYVIMNTLNHAQYYSSSKIDNYALHFNLFSLGALNTVKWQK